ncbi:MAG TPA: type II CAAX endopeptidase family protein [Ktedonobacteraceae bacterium]|nr:type II CAAX endopeptidase family protein [Ktedonobacteraceae bacterium]
MLKRPIDQHLAQEQEEESKVAPWTMRQTWLGIGLTMIPWIALALALNSLGNATSRTAPLSFRVDLLNAIITLIFSALIEGAFLIAPLYFANAVFRSLPSRTSKAFQALGFRKSSLGRAVGYILGFMLLIFIINFAYSSIITTFHLNLQTNDQVILARSKLAPITTYATLFAAVFIAPFCEEIFFRGFVFPGLLKGMPVGAAIVVSSLLFAVAHADPGSFVVLLVIGLALAFVRWSTNSIWPGMALHMLNNAIGALSILLVMWGMMKP